jgi:eukaryotic-like serine/threonine-protein kinase
MIGKTVGKYRIVERLGRGGMGTVYKGIDETLDRDVAIKVLNSDLGETDIPTRARNSPSGATARGRKSRARWISARSARSVQNATG